MGYFSEQYEENNWYKLYFDLLEQTSDETCTLHHIKTDVKYIMFQIKELNKSMLIFQDKYKEVLADESI